MAACGHKETVAFIGKKNPFFTATSLLELGTSSGITLLCLSESCLEYIQPVCWPLRLASGYAAVWMGWGDVCAFGERTFALRLKPAAAKHTGVPAGWPWPCGIPRRGQGSVTVPPLEPARSAPPARLSVHAMAACLSGDSDAPCACPGFACDTPGLQQKGQRAASCLRSFAIDDRWVRDRGSGSNCLCCSPCQPQAE